MSELNKETKEKIKRRIKEVEEGKAISTEELRKRLFKKTYRKKA